MRAVQVAYPQVWHACHRHRPTEAGLTERESAILAHLMQGDLRRLGALAEHMGVGTSTLSEAIDGLVRRGLVQRKRHADDKRKVDFEVTDAGAEAMSKGSPLDGAIVRRALERLEPAERKAAVEGLELLARACRDLRREWRAKS